MSKKPSDYIRPLLDAVEHSPQLVVWIGVFCAMIFLAGYAVLVSLLTSMEILEFSVKIPWATMIATYIFFVAVGSGLCIINALGSVFGMQRYEMMTKRMAFLSLTTIIFGMLCIVLHLGHPERMPIYNALSPNFRSAISWMGLLYSIYMAVVVVELWLLNREDLARRAENREGLLKKILELLTLEKLRGTRIGAVLEDQRLPRFVALLAFASGASALSMLGSVFAHLESRLLWYGPYYPVYFLVSAIFSGYAFLIVVTIITYRVKNEEIFPGLKAVIFEMAQVLALILAVGFLLIIFRLASGLLDPASREPVMLLINGPFSIGFWGFEVGLMSVLPIYVFIWAAEKKNLNGVLAGALMVLIGTFVMRYEFVVAGQVYPNIPQGLPSYWPTLMELFIIGGVIAAFLLVYTLGDLFLSLKEEKSPHVT
ncbi:MAG: polysulfide reductase NrfD [bacterium]|nr:polysulfide reductase NrfD [bacterium]